MRTYREQTRSELGLSPGEWQELTEFIDDIRPSIESARSEMSIEAPAPHVTESPKGGSDPTFVPGGWVGQYPADIYVYPDKLTTAEYEVMLDDITGWLEIWDVPTAAAVLPVFHTTVQEWRSEVLGYSQMLISYTEELLADRPPVAVERETEIGTKPRGPIDFQKTIKQRSQGNQDIAYRTTNFSLNHPLNLLLIQFHTELISVLDSLQTKSTVMSSTISQHREYHMNIRESTFAWNLVKRSMAIDPTDGEFLDQARAESRSNVGKIVDLWESYLQQKALSVDFEQQLNVGIKPISKIYELWILGQLLDVIKDLLDVEFILEKSSDLHTIRVTDNVTIHYNTPLNHHSRFLDGGLGSHPGRPDFAIEKQGTIVWIGDAKYSPERNIGLDSYQRLLTYMVDLMDATGRSTASIIHVDQKSFRKEINTADYNLTQSCLRPSDPTFSGLPLVLSKALGLS